MDFAAEGRDLTGMALVDLDVSTHATITIDRSI